MAKTKKTTQPAQPVSLSPYVVETDIPIPPKTSRPGMTQTLRDMKRNESIVISKGNISAVYAIAKKNSFKVTTRRMSEGTIRVWKL